MRERGTGTVQPVRRRGAVVGFRARMPGQRGAWLPGVFESRDEAEGTLRATLAHLATQPAQGGLTLGAWGEQALERRELAGQRSAAQSLSRWRCHVADSPLGRLALTTVDHGDVVAFVDDLATRRKRPGKGHRADAPAGRIAPSTAEAILVLVRVVLGDAEDRRLIDANPAFGVRLPRIVRRRATEEESSTYLMPDEQARLLASEAMPLRERLAVAFALGTGCRQASQWAVRLADVDLARGVVTLRKTKRGKPHVVPLLPIARLAVERWLPLRAEEERENRDRAERKGETFRPSDRLWTTVRGCARAGDHRDWQAWTEEILPRAGRHDGRHVRWHDLRHTCGTSLLCGWWSRRWSKEEVQTMLQHESVTTTERYARIAGDVLGEAVRATRLATELATGSEGLSGNPFDSAAPPARLERATFALGRPRKGEEMSGDRHDLSDTMARLRAAALDALRLAAGGDVELAGARALALAEDVVAAVDEALTIPHPATGAAS